ncbi:MAG: transposase [Crenarchaeota archaeon]|nr:transposase [Thermoproteota archaeon]
MTISLEFHTDDEEARAVLTTAWFSKLVAHRALRLVKENEVLADLSEYKFLKVMRSKCYDILPNRRYVDGMLKLIYSTLKSARALRVDIEKVELKQWLLFQSDGERGYARGNMNIRLINTHHVRVLTLDYDRKTRYVELKLAIPKGWRKLVEVLVEKATKGLIGYPARIIVKDYGIGKRGLHIHGELQIMIPYSLYLEVMRRYDKPRGNNVAGVDVNVDRLDAVVIDIYGNLLSYKTFWLKNSTFMGVRRKRSWSLIGEQIHALLKWLYSQGVSVIGLENPEIIGYLRYYWIRNGERKGRKWNWKVSMFRNSIIEKITWKAPLYSMKTIYVNPRNTSKEGEKIGKRLGLDRHLGSAYIIAKRALKYLQRP